MGLDKVIKVVNKAFGEGTLLRASEAKSLIVDRFGSGIFDLDLGLGGGVPRGRVVVYTGGYSSGKSSAAMLNVAQVQSTCRFCGTLFEHVDLLGEYHSYNCKCGQNEAMRCIWLDAEHSFDPTWAEKWGVDADNLYVIQTEFAEQAIDVTDKCIRSQECDLVVVDSVAALTPGIEVEESSQNQQVGVFARLMNKALRKWTSGLNSMGLLAETKCTIVLINQERSGIGPYAPKITSPGGRGIEFFSSVSVRFKRKEFIEDSDSGRPVGILVEYVIKKNKTAPVASPGTFSFYFVSGSGFNAGSTDIAEQVLRRAVFWNMIKKGGAWYTFSSGERFQGARKTADFLRGNPKLLELMMKQVRQREDMWIQKGSGAFEDEEEAQFDSSEDTSAEDVGGS
jgi:recombination protein RecA